MAADEDDPFGPLMDHIRGNYLLINRQSFNTLRPRQGGPHFQTHFHEWICMIVDSDFTEVCF